MIRKDNFIFNTMAEFLLMKVSADVRNTTYRTGSLDSDPMVGEPDIPFTSVVWIKDVQQCYHHGALWGWNQDRTSDKDLIVERAERIAGDELNRQRMEVLERKHDEEMTELSHKVERNICALEFDDEDGDITLVTSDASNITSGSMDDDGNVILDITLSP